MGREGSRQSAIASARKTRETDRMRMRNLLTATVCALLCTTATASTPKIVPRPDAHPGLWKLADADTTIYLFGTIHVLPKNYQWRTPVFNAVAKSANELVLEVAGLEDQAKTAQTFMSLALTPGLPPILDRVPPEKRAGLSNIIGKSGVPAATLNQFDTWAVAITLSAGMLRDLDATPDNGVERLLTKQFQAAHKPISGLETSEWQLGLFDTLPEPVQRTFLVGMIEEQADPATEFADMLASWSKGDDKAIALSFDDEMKLSPELTNVLLHQRNMNWADWLAKRLDKPGTVLVAVGAGHLAGDDSVLAMLTKRGFTVTRVQ
jgi:uncharacterized protein